MKILRSVNSRGSSVESAGYFTVLKANRWFPSSSLPQGFGYLGQHVKGAAPTPAPEQKALNHDDSKETINLSLFIEPDAQNHRLLRSALIVLAAIAITWSLLLWIMYP